MEDKLKDHAANYTHARWVASYWSRAFTQLSAQAAAKKETVSFVDLLVQFLNVNQVAVESGVKVAWRVDQDKWAHLGDRLRRKEHVVRSRI